MNDLMSDLLEKLEKVRMNFGIHGFKMVVYNDFKIRSASCGL